MREHPDFRFGVICTKDDLQFGNDKSLTNELSPSERELVEEEMVSTATDTVWAMVSSSV